MIWLIWPGALISVLGVIGLIYCIRAAAKAKAEAESKSPENEAKTEDIVRPH